MKKKYFFIPTIASMFFFSSFIFVTYTNAQTNTFFIEDPLKVEDAGPKGANQSPEETVEKLVIRVVSSVLGLVGVISFIIFIYSGLLWMFAGGNESKIAETKKIMLWAIIGLVIALSSYVILRTVFQTLTDAFGISAS